jgi:hypothetical protein
MKIKIEIEPKEWHYIYVIGNLLSQGEKITKTKIKEELYYGFKSMGEECFIPNPFDGDEGYEAAIKVFNKLYKK